jgi:hypothetical protein
MRPDGVSTAPHLRLQEWPPVRISRSGAAQQALARSVGNIADRLLDTDLRRAQLTIWAITTAVAIAHRQQHGDVRWRACSWREAVATP